MSKGKELCKETDIARAIRAACKADLNVTKFKITKQGEIEVAPATAPTTTELVSDEWKVAS
jgi:hypothetical protein